MKEDDKSRSLEKRWQYMRLWQQILCVVGLIAGVWFVIDVLATLIVTGQPPSWSGFGPDTSAPAATHMGLIYPAKTLWDWIQLLVVPVGLAIVTIYFTRRDNDRQKEIAEARNLAERTRQEQTLETYIDRMSELLYHKETRAMIASDPDIREAIQVRTAITIRRLDAEHNRILISFLRESELLRSGDFILIDLSTATLSYADLRGIDLGTATVLDQDALKVVLDGCNLSHATLAGSLLRGASLIGANLAGADLTGADLAGANLTGADLMNANVTDADLTGANLTNIKH